MDLELEGKTVVVTGASKGIGYACAERLLTDGYAVAICARNADEVNAAAEIGRAHV